MTMVHGPVAYLHPVFEDVIANSCMTPLTFDLKNNHFEFQEPSQTSQEPEVLI